MRDEILEQPGVAARLIGDRRDAIAAIAAAVRARQPDYLVISARGTSDHAAIYAQYVLGARHRLPVALSTPSLLSLYGVAPRFANALVIGISQSGASPDVVGVVAAARQQGALTIAIANDPRSPLAMTAEHVIDLGAGPERAVAATKTYTGELVAIALLSAALSPDPAADAALLLLPEALARATDAEPAVRRVAGDQASMTRCIVLGRGFHYATAREWALKLKELAYVLADPYSAADFRHGPLALVEPGFAVLAVAPSGATSADLVALLTRLKAEQGADLLVLSDRAETRGLGRWALPIPPDLPEWLVPIVSIVAGQLHAYHLTLAKGLDPETPRHIGKVTLTR